MLDFSLILPTYNESENIKIILPRLIALLTPLNINFEIIVVDDNSPDKTWQIAQDFSSHDPRIKVLRRYHDKGLSSAILFGMEASSGKKLGVIDADLQHDETLIPKMLEYADHFKIVVGSRIASQGSYGQWKFSRKFMSQVANFLAKNILSVQIGDPMSGFFIISRELFEQVSPSIHPKGFKILLEFLYRSNGKHVKEVPYTFQERIHGKTKLDSSVIKNYILSLIELRFGNKFSNTFIKYCLVGSFGMIINFVMRIFVTLFEHDVTDAEYIIFQINLPIIIGSIFSILNNYFLNNIFTFNEKQIVGFYNNCIGLSKFTLVSLFGFVIQYSIWKNSMNHVHAISPELMHYQFISYFANFMGIVFATLSNYLLNKTFTWNQTKTSSI